jgi:hypothetical protein
VLDGVKTSSHKFGFSCQGDSTGMKLLNCSSEESNAYVTSEGGCIDKNPCCV